MFGKATNGRGMLRMLALTSLAMGLGACGQTKPVLVLPPIDLTQCLSEPRAPDLPGHDQQDVRDMMTLDYILALRAAGGDCRAKVNGLRVWRETAN